MINVGIQRWEGVLLWYTANNLEGVDQDLKVIHHGINIFLALAVAGITLARILAAQGCEIEEVIN